MLPLTKCQFPYSSQKVRLVEGIFQNNLLSREGDKNKRSDNGTEVKPPALLGVYDRPTDRPTDGQTGSKSVSLPIRLV